jgi:nucleoside-diphosphate-sugar epimerase
LAQLARDGVPAVGLGSMDMDLTAPGAGAVLGSRLQPSDALVFVSALTPDKGKNIATLMRNLRMGEAVAVALAAQPVAQVVYVSTDAVYHDDANPVSERACCQPASLHGVMHMARERMLIETLRTSGTPLAILRPALLYGPGDTHNGYGPNRFLRLALAGQPISLFGGGAEQRDHVFIEDLTKLLSLVLAHRSAGVLNVATGQSASFAEIARLAVETSRSVSRVLTTSRANPTTYRHFDVSARIAAFPVFRFTSLKEGLSSMWQWLDEGKRLESIARP